jgi:mycofactocin system glycosyltransferase
VTVPVPEGWRLRLDHRTRVLHGGRTLLAPAGRMLRLGAGGPQAVADLGEGSGSPAARRLGRTLLDASAAHPQPGAQPADDVTVVVPVKDRTAALGRCLAALRGCDVLVVDDGSADPAAVAAVCRTHGARYVHRPNGGPGAARNTALPLLHKDFVAFLDSDCVPEPGWLERLRGHLQDPAVAAVAPRVVGGARSPLDLGRRPALVRPGGEVSYVPTAALLFRRSALTPFDEQLRYGEDVDLVWRTVDAGWQVRYDPTVVVAHEEPARLADRLVRRFRYGTSAAALAERHPARLAHLVLSPWPTAVLALVLARRPGLAAAAAGATVLRLDRQVEDLPAAAALVGQSVRGTGLGLGRALALLGPLAWLAAVRDRRVAALLVAPYLVEWSERRPARDPVGYTATALLDQAAYGAGVLAGCLRGRTTVPLRPRTR